jgi:hypothetical protein
MIEVKIISYINRIYNVDIKEKTRKKEIFILRQLACLCIWYNTGFSLRYIGEIFDCNPSMIRRNILETVKRYEENDMFYNRYKDLLYKFNIDENIIQLISLYKINHKKILSK